MSDDIVTRLRRAVAQTAEADTLPSWDFATVVWEAADEIERLRAEIKAFVYQWELSERGVHNGAEYFASVHNLRQEVRGE